MAAKTLSSQWPSQLTLSTPVSHSANFKAYAISYSCLLMCQICFTVNIKSNESQTN